MSISKKLLKRIKVFIHCIENINVAKYLLINRFN